MITELRTYTLQPGTVGEFEARFAKRHPVREKHSTLGGFWHTELGTLNQVLHAWPYEDLKHRAQVREAMAKDPERQQLPGGRDLIVAQESWVMLPAPFMRPLGSRNYGSGNIYEMRIYTYAPGDIQAVLKGWAEVIEEREKFSPLAGCWYTDTGALNKFIHLWVYPDFNTRTRVREESRKSGRWPAQTGVRPVQQENKILIPAPFSPLQ
jgi:NIPSNAP